MGMTKSHHVNSVRLELFQIVSSANHADVDKYTKSVTECKMLNVYLLQFPFDIYSETQRMVKPANVNNFPPVIMAG